VDDNLPTTELVVIFYVNHEEHVLRALADTGASSSVILTSKDLFNNDKDNKTTWSTICGPFTTDKIGLLSFLFPELNLKKQISWEFHVDDRSKASDTYGMIIGRYCLRKFAIMLNFNDKTVTWDTDRIIMKDRGSLSA
jgi:hypothetical protein